MGTRVVTSAWRFSLCVLVVTLAGCGSDVDVRKARKAELLSLGLACHSYAAKHSDSGPREVEDLKEVSIGAPLREKVRAGEYILFWSFPINQRGRDGTLARQVLGYERDARLSGGLVLMGDGMVVEMTSDQLQRALTP